jgi:hypothetical protein
MESGLNYDLEISNALREADASDTRYRLDCFVTSEVAHNEVISKYRPAPCPVERDAYLGVGPCQNFTYVGALMPSLAIVVDARVDNLVEHLMFRLVFERADDPLQYLALLFSREVPAAGRHAAVRSPAELVDAFHRLAWSADVCQQNVRWLEDEMRTRWQAPPGALRRLARIYDEFSRRQLAITSVSEACLANLDRIPTFEEVLLASSSQGFNFHFLTDRDRYAYVRDLQLRSRVVPVLGSLTAVDMVSRVNRILDAEGCRLATVYLSNMEEFLLDRYRIGDDRVTERPNPDGLMAGAHGEVYDRLVRNLAALTRTDDCGLIRFYFPGSHAGRLYGVWPWLEPSVCTLRQFLAGYSAARPRSVFETYV